MAERHAEIESDDVGECAFWYVKRGKWTRLGVDRRSALTEYAAITSAPGGGLADLWERTERQLMGKVAKSTLRQYKTAARKLLPVFVEFSPQQVKPKHVAGFMDAMSRTPNMANRCLTVLTLMFDHAVKWQEVDANPCFRIPRHDERKRDRYLSDAEVAAIRAKAPPRLQAMIDVLYLTGQRVSDVLRLRRADLTDEGIAFRQGKTGVRLTVAWTPELRAAVGVAKALHGKVERLTLFANRKGKAPDYSSVRTQWETACKAAGVEDAHLHDLRAKSATDAKRGGQDATALMGHTSPAMTARYLRLRESPVVQGPSFIRQSKDTNAK